MERNNTILLALLTGLFVVLTLHPGYADPTGSSIIYNNTAGTPSPAADSRADARGTITTIILSATQQDQNWKGYVGNVTGVLSLDDASGNTLYDWQLTGGISGEVYVTRASGPDFSNVSCPGTIRNNVTAEHPLYNMTDTQADSINVTFNDSNHQGFFVGSTEITADSCPSIATYINDTAQTIDGTQSFQEVIILDNAANIVFTTIIDDNTAGFDNGIYDFQLIVPESDVNLTSTTYYFYTELSG
ncbi:MAG: hypothetical protein OXR66_07290 [Candidatus Woesearchaeota archaeon]|nr:hypothetical protein [Candidatus Woesearchaeota archaeon]